MRQVPGRGRTVALAVAAMIAGALGLRGAPAHPGHGPTLDGGPTNFVTVSDGTSIAVTVIFPTSFDPNDVYDEATGSGGYPVIFEMAGYENGSTNAQGRTTLGQVDDWFLDQTGRRVPGMPLTGDTHRGTGAFHFDGEYVSVHAQVRGTGCSAGEFDLFNSRTALDGYDVIEDWVVKQPWSNRKVGILGHSYSGITGFFVAAMEGKAKREGRPNHLVSITVSGLIDDLYRGIVYPGGVTNALFPPLWTLGVRPAYDVLGGTLQGIVRNLDDHPEIAAQCAANVATHRRTVLNDPVLQGINDLDNDWWRARSLTSVAQNVAHPIHVTGAFQDEQTGPRFPHIWEVVPSDTPKRLLMSNGDHGTQVDPAEVWQDRKAWMDYWMRDVPNPFVPDPDDRLSSVRTLLELHPSPSGLVSNGIKDSTTFPLEDTTWTPYFLSPGGTLSATGPGAGGTASYLSGSKRQSWSYEAGPGAGTPYTTADGPDELRFRSEPFPADTLIDGPITANLFLSSTANDTALFVQVADYDAASNRVSILQRGMLKASHRAVEYPLSDFDEAHGNFLYRPFRPHTNPTDVKPCAPDDGDPDCINEYLIEIFPVAHVFRKDHRLQVKIMAPPAVDSLYAYVPKELPLALNTVHFDAGHPSRITLPVVSLAGVSLGAPLATCSSYWEVRCVPA